MLAGVVEVGFATRLGSATERDDDEVAHEAGRGGFLIGRKKKVVFGVSLNWLVWKGDGGDLLDAEAEEELGSGCFEFGGEGHRGRGSLGQVS